MDLIIGTAGHIDHGKTALVRALTGTDADRLPEEKQRGITIDLGFAEMKIGDAHFGFVDVPGHERFVRNMLAGAHGIDHILLVVAATEGFMPQTREHFDICRLLDIKSGTIVLTKCDLADSETIELAKLEVAKLVDGTFLGDAKVIETSAISGLGIEQLKQQLSIIATGTLRHPENMAARLPIDRSFTVRGFGTVVTGTLTAGELAVGSEMELLPSNRRLRIRGIQSHGIAADNARVGQRTAVNLAGISHDEISRGLTLVESDVFQTTRSFDAKIEMLADAARPLKSRQRVRLHIGTSEVMARVTVLDQDGEIAAGKSGHVHFRPETEMLTITGDRFVFRSYSPQRTIGGGVVLDPFAPRHRRKDFEQITGFLASLSAGINDIGVLATHFIDAAKKHGEEIGKIAARLGCTKTVIESKLSAENVALVDGRYYGGEFVPTSPLAAPKRSVELTPEELDLKRQLVDIYKLAGRDVPRFDEVLARIRTTIPRKRIDEVIRHFADGGDLVKVSDEFIFPRGVIDEIVVLVKNRADSTVDRVIDVAIFKELTGLSRKYAIPLLEYLDRTNVTRRYGDKRIIL